MIHLILDIIIYTFFILMVYHLNKQGAFRLVFFAIKHNIKKRYSKTTLYKKFCIARFKIIKKFFKKRTVKKLLKKEKYKTLKPGEKKISVYGNEINAKNRDHANKKYVNIKTLEVINPNKKKLKALK